MLSSPRWKTNQQPPAEIPGLVQKGPELCDAGASLETEVDRGFRACATSRTGQITRRRPKSAWSLGPGRWAASLVGSGRRSPPASACDVHSRPGRTGCDRRACLGRTQASYHRETPARCWRCWCCRTRVGSGRRRSSTASCAGVDVGQLPLREEFSSCGGGFTISDEVATIDCPDGELRILVSKPKLSPIHLAPLRFDAKAAARC
jgi:hypothetical protein